MIYVVIAGFVLIGLTCLFFYIAENTNFEVAGLIFGIISAFSAIAIWIFIGFGAYSYISAEHKAKIINREYKTNYTQEEIFYANDVIETIQQIQRKRVEVNGDLFKK